MSELPNFTDLGNGIYCVDTEFGRPSMAACYLMVSDGAAAFMDTGTAYTVPSLLALLDHLGLSPDAVKYVMPTHVHLDHAGGAGQLMAACPNATLVIHPKGAPHMIDPSRLAAGATAVYGEEVFARDFDRLLPIPEERCIVAEDGQSFDLAGRALVFLDTPGHANHHGCIWDEKSRGFFTGDTFGIAYPDLYVDGKPWLFAPTTPVAFDPEAWHQSVDKLMAYDPQRMYLTHFGEMKVTPALAERLHASINILAEAATGLLDAGDDRASQLHDRIDQLLLDEAAEAGVTLERDRVRQLLSTDIDLNAQGLNVWLVRQEKRKAAAG